jgi:hypothetical protein
MHQRRERLTWMCAAFARRRRLRFPTRPDGPVRQRRGCAQQRDCGERGHRLHRWLRGFRRIRRRGVGGLGGRVLRREISRDGLFLALGFTLVTVGFVGCVLGLLVGPDDQAGFFAFLGGICALVLLGFGYTRLRRIDLSPTPDPPEVEAGLGPFPSGPSCWRGRRLPRSS